MADAHPPQKAAWWRSPNSFDEEALLASHEFDCPGFSLLPPCMIYLR
jgi:hypothetical protein